MTVQVTNLQGNAGARIVTSYSDTLQGADNPPYMGAPWMPLLAVGGTGVTGALVDAQINKAAGGTTFGGGGLLQPNMVFVPSVINMPKVMTGAVARGIFAEAKLSAKVAGVSCTTGPCVGFNPDPSLWWGLCPQSVSTSADLFRQSGAVLTSLAATVFNYAINDVFRIEARIVGADTQLKCYQNGVLKTTFTDVGLTNPTGGLYGMWYISNNTGSETWQNFNGGLL